MKKLNLITLIIQNLDLVAQMVKNLPAMSETLVRSLGEEALDKGMATHSSILVWRIPCMEEPGRLQLMSSLRVDMLE